MQKSASRVRICNGAKRILRVAEVQYFIQMAENAVKHLVLARGVSSVGAA